MARDRLAAIRARQQLDEAAQQPSAPHPPISAHNRHRSDPYDSGAPRDFNPYGDAPAESSSYVPARPSRVDVELPQADFQPYESPRQSLHSRSYSAGAQSDHNRPRTSFDRGGGGGGGSMSRSSSAQTSASRRQARLAGNNSSNHDVYPVPPVPASFGTSSPQDFTTPPLAGASSLLHSPPPEAPLPRDFDPNDARSTYAMQYRSDYGTPPQQARHETQYVPSNPRQTRQRSLSGGAGTAGRTVGNGGRRMSNVPLVPQLPRGSVETVSYGGGGGGGYDGEADKASTVDLVEGRDSYDRRGSEGKKMGGPTVSKGQVQFEEMGAFFEEISDLQQAIREGNGSIQSIIDLHNRMLATASSEDAQAILLRDQLDERATSTRALFAQLKNRLHVLEQGNANLRALIPLGQSMYGLSLADVQVREQQVGALKERFKDAIQRYAEAERDNRNKQRARLEKQVKVVNPGMTAFEVSEVVKAAEAGGDNAMFSQALATNGYRSQAARGALREAQNRAAELARIEQTLIELAQLFSDMAVLVHSQDVQIVKIEQNAVAVEQDMESGLTHVKKAVVHARNARKWRWVCCIMMTIVLAIVLIVVGVVVIKPIVEDHNAKVAAQRAANPPASSTTPPPAAATTPAPAPATTAAAAAAISSAAPASATSAPVAASSAAVVPSPSSSGSPASSASASASVASAISSALSSASSARSSASAS